MRTGDYPCTHILVSYDGSPAAHRALELSAELWRAHADRVEKVTLLRAVSGDYLDRRGHNVDLRVVNKDQVSWWQRRRGAHLNQKVRPSLEEARHFLEEQGVQAKIATRVVPGPIVGAILRTADQEGVSTICMGRHGVTRFAKFFLGSVAWSVLTAVRHVTVYITGSPRTPSPGTALFPALVAVDGSALSLRAVQEAAILAQAENRPAALTLVHVVDAAMLAYNLGDVWDTYVANGQEILSQAGNILQDAGLTNTWQEKLLTGGPAQVIAQEAEEGRYATIFMGHRGVSALTSLFLGSVATNVIHRVEYPTVALVYD